MYFVVISIVQCILGVGAEGATDEKRKEKYKNNHGKDFAKRHRERGERGGRGGRQTDRKRQRDRDRDRETETGTGTETDSQIDR